LPIGTSGKKENGCSFTSPGRKKKIWSFLEKRGFSGLKKCSRPKGHLGSKFNGWAIEEEETGGTKGNEEKEREGWRRLKE